VLAAAAHEAAPERVGSGGCSPRTGVLRYRSMLSYRVRGGSMGWFLPVAIDGSPLLRGLTLIHH
jgi:hypothetical protein